MKLSLRIQAALVIGGRGIRSFDYSRVRKQGKTTKRITREYSILAKFRYKLPFLVFVGLNFSGT